MSRARDELVLGAVSRARLSKTGWLRGNCPFCELHLGKVDRKQCLGLHVLSGKWHCFRCSAGGLVQDVPDDLRPFQAQALAAPEVPPVTGPPEGFFPLFEGDGLTSIACEPARDYVLRQRGLALEVAREIGIGACVTGYYSGRVIIPVLGVDRDWLWWVGRAWSKHAERPYDYPTGSRDGVLFNQAALLVETDEPALIVEGCFDAAAYWPDGVAVLGKPTEAHLEAFIAARRPCAVVLDGDAHEQGWALAMRLRFEGQRSGSVKLPPRVDPDEVDKAWLREEARRCLLSS